MFNLFFEVLKKNLIFDYNSFGNRINFVATFGGAKHVYDNQTLMLEKSTYYILDASGNQLSMYEHIVDDTEVNYYLTERNIYGSSRLGTLKDPVNMLNAHPLQSYGILGNRNYELSNHLGNVLTVISDIKYPLSSDNTSIDSYEVGISNVFDYSPFGAPLDGRTIQNEMYSPVSSDTSSQTTPIIAEIYKNEFDSPPATTSPYTGATTTLDGNLSNPVWTSSTGDFTNYNSTGAGSGKSIAIKNASPDTSYVTLSLDVDSGYLFDITSYSFAHRSSSTGYDSYKLVVNGIEIGTGSIYVASSGSTLQSTGVVNVSNVVSGVTGTVNVVLKLYGGLHGSTGTFRMDDFILNGYTQEENTGNGSGNGYVVMGGYRYGFNGHERDDEVSGAGNSYTAEFWQYDPRLGRRWNIDPVVKPHKSPYATFANNPIWFVDLYGADTSFFDDEGKYDQQAKDDFIKAYNTVRNKLDHLSESLESNLNAIKALNIDDRRGRKEYQKLKSERDGLLSEYADWALLSMDFQVIMSELFPTVTYSTNVSNLKPEEQGKTIANYNSSGNLTSALVTFRSGKYSTVVHENRHVRQSRSMSKLASEVQAYRFQQIYSYLEVQERISNALKTQYPDADFRPLPNQYGIIEMVKYVYKIE